MICSYFPWYCPVKCVPCQRVEGVVRQPNQRNTYSTTAAPCRLDVERLIIQAVSERVSAPTKFALLAFFVVLLRVRVADGPNEYAKDVHTPQSVGHMRSESVGTILCLVHASNSN